MTAGIEYYFKYKLQLKRSLNHKLRHMDTHSHCPTQLDGRTHFGLLQLKDTHDKNGRTLTTTTMLMLNKNRNYTTESIIKSICDKESCNLMVKYCDKQIHTHTRAYICMCMLSHICIPQSHIHRPGDMQVHRKNLSYLLEFLTIISKFFGRYKKRNHNKAHFSGVVRLGTSPTINAIFYNISQ